MSSLDLEEQLRIFLASAPQKKHAIATVEFTHSAMTHPWRLWREPYVGEITTEAGEVSVLPVNLEIRLAGSQGNLDQNFEIRLDTVDIHDAFRGEMKRIPVGTREKVRAVYREYLSDDLAQVQAYALLQVESVSYERGLATLSAVSPRLNATRTGENYNTRDVPMLRGFQ